MKNTKGQSNTEKQDFFYKLQGFHSAAAEEVGNVEMLLELGQKAANGLAAVKERLDAMGVFTNWGCLFYLMERSTTAAAEALLAMDLKNKPLKGKEGRDFLSTLEDLRNTAAVQIDNVETLLDLGQIAADDYGPDVKKTVSGMAIFMDWEDFIALMGESASGAEEALMDMDNLIVKTTPSED